jgi:HK97 family phage major capsid protein
MDYAFQTFNLAAYEYASLTAMPRTTLLQDSHVEIEAYTARRLGEDLAYKLEANYQMGTGTNMPQGVISRFAYSGTNPGTFTLPGASSPQSLQYVETATENVWDYADARKAWGALPIAYSGGSPNRPGAQISGTQQGFGGGPVWMLTKSMHETMLGWEDSEGQLIYNPSITGAVNDTLLGAPIVYAAFMPDPIAVKAVMGIYGNFGRLFIIRDVSNITIESTTDYNFPKRQLTLMAHTRTDSDFLDYQAAVAIVNSKATA